jgi:hypothetical protein
MRTPVQTQSQQPPSVAGKQLPIHKIDSPIHKPKTTPKQKIKSYICFWDWQGLINGSHTPQDIVEKLRREADHIEAMANDGIEFHDISDDDDTTMLTTTDPVLATKYDFDTDNYDSAEEDEDDEEDYQGDDEEDSEKIDV